jgi:DNA-binding NarL/FixJ family response regulator
MAEGRSNRGIATALVVTVPAIERHITSIFEKMELQQSSGGHRRVLAVLEYQRSSATERSLTSGASGK